MNWGLRKIIYNLAASRIYWVFISLVFSIIQWLLVFTVLHLHNHRLWWVRGDQGGFEWWVRINQLVTRVTRLALMDKSVDILWMLLSLHVVLERFLVQIHGLPLNSRRELNWLWSSMRKHCWVLLSVVGSRVCGSLRWVGQRNGVDWEMHIYIR